MVRLFPFLFKPLWLGPLPGACLILLTSQFDRWGLPNRKTWILALTLLSYRVCDALVVVLPPASSSFVNELKINVCSIYRWLFKLKEVKYVKNCLLNSHRRKDFVLPGGSSLVLDWLKCPINPAEPDLPWVGMGQSQEDLASVFLLLPIPDSHFQHLTSCEWGACGDKCTQPVEREGDGLLVLGWGLNRTRGPSAKLSEEQCHLTSYSPPGDGSTHSGLTPASLMPPTWVSLFHTSICPCLASPQAISPPFIPLPHQRNFIILIS